MTLPYTISLKNMHSAAGKPAARRRLSTLLIAAIFPLLAWQQSLFIGSLKDGALIRQVVDGDKIVHEEGLLEPLDGRIRDVRIGPDGYVYVLTDSPQGRLLRIGLKASGLP